MPELPPKGDVSDWISYGKSKEQLDEIIQKAIENKELEIQKELLPNKFSFVTFDDKKKSIVISKQRFVEWINSNKAVFTNNIKIISDSLRIFNDKYWKIAFDSDLEKFIFFFFEKHGLILQNNFIDEALKIIKRFNFETIKLEKDFTNQVIIPFQNGTLYYSLKSSTFNFITEFKKSDYSLFVLTSDFEEWMIKENAWQETIIGSSLFSTYEKDALDAIQMFFASVFIPSLNHQKALYLYGEFGGEGKGLLTNTFASLFTPETTSYLNVSSWEKQHENISLANSLLNISTEISSHEIGTVGFKSIIAQDYITFNPKYESPLKVKPLAKHIFTANDLLNMCIGTAELRRLILINAKQNTNVLLPNFAYEYRNQKKYLLNFALMGLINLYEKNFIIDYTDPVLKNKIISENESLFDFFEDKISINPISKIDLNELYGEFRDWRGFDSPVKLMVKSKFAKHLQNLLKSLNIKFTTKREKIDNKFVTFYFGIALK